MKSILKKIFSFEHFYLINQDVISLKEKVAILEQENLNIKKNYEQKIENILKIIKED